MMKYMYKKILTAVASAVMFLTAGQVMAQVIEVPYEDWTVTYANGDNGGSSFGTNHWSHEGDTDDSGMIPDPVFLQQHIGTGNLPQTQWKKTISGLVPRGAYVFTALVRAYKEDGTSTPHGVTVFAGSQVSDDIVMGKATLSNPGKGRFMTCFLNCEADENGNLEVGVNINVDNGSNWVAMKGMSLYRTSLYSFIRVTDGQIQSGEKYFFVHHEDSNSEDGIALDGNYRNIDKIESAVFDNKLAFKTYGSWQGIKAVLDFKNAYTIEAKEGSDTWAIIGNQGSKRNLYPGAGFIIYADGYNSSITSDDNGTFKFSRPDNSHYVVYKDNVFKGDKSPVGSDLFLYKEHANFKYLQSHYEAVVNDAFIAPAVTVDKGNWTLKYSSSNTSVAIVDENTGAVSLVGGGNAFISAKYLYDENLAISYHIKVKERGIINWNPISQVLVGEDITEQLNLWTNSNGEVTYTSSNPDVLFVSSDGRTITAVNDGSATITASIPETDSFTSAISSSINITVVEPFKRKFIRISELSDIESGANYLIARQKAINENDAMVLDGNQTGGAALPSKIINSIIEQYAKNSFVITSLAGGKYSIKGNGNDKYIDPKDTEITYQNSSASLQIEHEGDGFVIRRVAGANDSKYIVYEGGSFTGRKNATGSSRKVYIYKEVDLSKQIAHLTFWSEGDWVTAGKTLKTDYWTDNESGKISYISSNPSIATIDANGVVTGVAPGDVDILAVLHEDATHYSVSSCVTITVMDDYTDPQLIFGPQGGVTEIPIKSTLRTETSHRGGGVVVYNSSDPTVADIDANGVIHTYNVGHTVLTARLSADGFYTEASKSFMLTVIKRDPLVTPSFTYKAIALGEKTNLLLTTESTGAHHFSTSDAGIATIDANGVITSKGVGEVQIGYWVDECDNYNASVVQYVTLKVTEAAKKTPIIQITPSEVIVPVGGSMRVLAEMIDFGGQYSAALETATDIAEMQQLNRGGFEATYNVTGLKPGTTYIVFTCAETQDYYKFETRIPVTVLDIYQYNLVIGGEVPSKGVSVEIAGVTHTSAGTFNTYRTEINVSDVVVRPVAGYMASVSISGRTITVTYALKGVTAGTFIRLRNYNCNLYATLSADGQSLGVAAEGLSNILYLDKNNHLLFYQNGQYVKSTNVMGNVGDAGSIYTFTRGSGEYKECFSIKSNENKYLLASSTGTTTGTSAGNDFAYWYVEELTELPVNVSTAGYGYATIYCPVALNIAGGADAYYVSRKERKANSTGVEYWLTLSPFKSSIPANTPAVIIGVPGTTYQFGLVEPNNEGDITVAAGMTGHVAASLTSSISGKVFTLQPNSQEEKVGFYPWNNRVTYGFKAYFTSSNNEAAYYRLVFEGEEATDILQLEAIEAQETIYDLCGRSMGDSVESLPRGIYVRAGRKFVVK